MTNLAIICEKWPIQLEDPQDDNPWFLDWLLRSPKHVSGHLTRSFHAFQSIKDYYGPGEIDIAMEHFGGIGAHALMIEDLFDPSVHVVQDYSQEAVDHMLRVLPVHMEARQADSYDPSSFCRADLQAWDCGDFTVWKSREGEKHREALDRIFATEPKAVTITDIAAPYLHLHRDRYETLLGTGSCTNYGTYIRAFASRLELMYGYSLLAGFSDRWSTVMAFVPMSPGLPQGDITPTPDSPVGLELI